MAARNYSHEYICHDCGMPLDAQHQSDGKGGSYVIVTCWNPQCLLRTVTRSVATYSTLTDSDWEAYREMNRSVASNPSWYGA